MGNVTVRELFVTGLLAFLTVTVVVVAFFGVGFATGERIPFANGHFASDIWHQNLPFRAFFHRQLAAGHLPLWCPEMGTGYPLLAEGQVGALYPPNLLIHTLFPFAAAFNLTILATMILAGTGASLYARQVGAGRGPALLAAVVFGLSGWMLVHLANVNYTATAAWAPLLLLLLERIGAGAGRRTMALLAVAIGIMLLAGSPQLAYYNLLLLLFYALLLAARQDDWRTRLRPLGAAFGAVLVGFLLAAPQLLPSRELKSMSPRTEGVDLEMATFSGMAPRHLLLFLAPKAYGDNGTLHRVPAIDEETGEALRHPTTGEPLERVVSFESELADKAFFWEVTAYVGILPLLLAAVAVLTGIKRRAVAFALGILVLSVVLALGKSGGLYVLLFRILPGFDWFRVPGRFLVYADLMLAVLAALGLTRLLALLPERRRIVLGAAATAVAAIVVVVDLHLALGDQNPTIEADRWLSPPETVEAIEAREADRGDPFRISTLDPQRLVFRNAHFRALGWTGDLTPYDPARLTLHPNLGILFGISSSRVYSPLPLPWPAEVMSLLHRPMDYDTGLPQGVNPKISRLLNVRYLIDPFGAARGRVTPLGEYEGDILYRDSLILPLGPPYRIRLYEDPEALPRAWLVPDARVVPDPRHRMDGNLTATQEALLSRWWDPEGEVLITESKPGPALEPAGASGGQAGFLAHEPTRVAIETTSDGPAWLFLGDSWYPGWQATIDGEAAPVRRANIFGRAVRVPGGKHEVVFTYECAPFDRGLLLAGLGLALLAALFFSARRRPTRPEHASSPPPGPQC